jgi:hypothetical protein
MITLSKGFNQVFSLGYSHDHLTFRYDDHTKCMGFNTFFFLCSYPLNFLGTSYDHTK